MSEPITPALTPKLWKEALSYGDPAQFDSHVSETPEIRHYLAALNLYGQPFGFGWKDVDELRSYSRDGWHRPVLESLAARIAALLPPRET